MADDATDLAYVGEFRHIKGADLLVEAVARLHEGGKKVTLTLGGDGEETAALKAQVDRLGLSSAIRFIGHVKARYGFSKGRLLVVPSRGDSMPYVVIEAGAAGIPMIAASVGGIPEIFGQTARRCLRRATPRPWPKRSRPRSTIRRNRAARASPARAHLRAFLPAGDG